uniref:RING-type domain-containing protein n=1 Tax=Neogobius melanostomus TaxID=47308 RepID=A0A8C6WSZ4_9GOBI
FMYHSNTLIQMLFTEEQLLCSICLDVFTEPVSTPCGHNFCKSCIFTHWQQDAPCCCPLCKQEFSSRPLLQVNTLVSELVGQFRNRSEEASLSSDTPAAEGDVLCDMCTESKQKALKSCLVCLMSYCQLHLLAHESLPRLKTHPLMEPLGQLEERLCSSHHRAETKKTERGERSAHRQAEDWTTQLQQELNELQRRSTELEQLQRSNDHLTFLQNLPRVKTTTGLKDWSQISLQEPALRLQWTGPWFSSFPLSLKK